MLRHNGKTPPMQLVTMGAVLVLVFLVGIYMGGSSGRTGCTGDSIHRTALWSNTSPLSVPSAAAAAAPNAAQATKEAAAVLQRRRMHMPGYTRCFQKPRFHLAGVQGDCNMLITPESRAQAWKVASGAFRAADKVLIDAQQCRMFMNDTTADSSRDVVEAQADHADRLAPREVFLRPHSTDHDVFLQVYCGGDFEFLSALTQYVPLDRPVSMLDAGGNVGLASILFSQLLQFSGEVLAVEANPATYDVLKKNLHGLTDVVTPVLAAVVPHTVAETGKKLNFSGAADQYWGFRVEHQTQDYEGKVMYSVDTRSLAQLRDMTKAKHFDFIKLDIEGEEKYIFQDETSQRVLCQARCMFMELHDRFEPGCTAAFKAFLNTGCHNGGDHHTFKQVTMSGEYLLLCQDKLVDGQGGSAELPA